MGGPIDTAAHAVMTVAQLSPPIRSATRPLTDMGGDCVFRGAQ
jgi:hypothetical protein